jgi:hypothetical protein
MYDLSYKLNYYYTSYSGLSPGASHPSLRYTSPQRTFCSELQKEAFRKLLQRAIKFTLAAVQPSFLVPSCAGLGSATNQSKNEESANRHLWLNLRPTHSVRTGASQENLSSPRSLRSRSCIRHKKNAVCERYSTTGSVSSCPFPTQ